MAAPKQPQQPSNRTFLIRRIVVLLVLAGLIWGIIALVSGAVNAVGNWLGGSKPAASVSTSGSTAPTNADGSPKYTTCMPAGLDVQALVGDGAKPASTFGAGSNPRFWFTLTNTSSKACYFNVGTAAQVFKVTSGSELIWSNADCKSATTNFRMLLEPGVTKTSNPISWDRVRSSSSGCDAASGQAKTTGGGASYHLQLVLNGIASNDVQFILN